MKQVLLLILILLSAPAAVLAQEADKAALYQVADVAVEITSDQPAHARDQAIQQAERQAFDQLMGRLGIETAPKLSDDAVANLVQAFEVQQEKVSPHRYIGTFTIKFRANAVRSALQNAGTSFTETQSKPVLILPVVATPAGTLLWDNNAKWWAAWREAVHGSSTVPLVLPTGDNDDRRLTADAALAGSSDALAPLIARYDAKALVIAVLKADPDRPALAAGQPFVIDAVHYNAMGQTPEPLTLTAAPPTDSDSLRAALNQGVRQIRAALEKEWKDTAKIGAAAAARLPVVVDVDSLASWSAIKHQLDSTPSIRKTHLVAIKRGAIRIELDYRGDLHDLVSTLATANLTLAKNPTDAAWHLAPRG